MAEAGPEGLRKVVLAREVRVRADEPFDRGVILSRLRRTFPGCFLYLVVGYLGASPELLVSRVGDVVRIPLQPAPPTLGGEDGNAHFLGTDPQGRDIFSQLLYGARAAFLLGFVAPTTPPTGPAGKAVVGYFAEWGVYGRNYHVKNIHTSGSAAKLTHILYAFGNTTGGRCTIGDSYADYDKAYTAADSVDGVGDTWDTGALRGSFKDLPRQHYTILKRPAGAWRKASRAMSAKPPPFGISISAPGFPAYLSDTYFMNSNVRT